MSYTYDILIDDPVAFWSFNVINSGSANDSSGNGHAANLTGSYSLVLPIVARGGNSLKLNADAEVRYNLDGFLESLLSGKSYSADLWIRSEGDNPTAAILARGSDGLFLEGTKLSFHLGQYTIEYEGINLGDIYHVSVSYDQDGAYMHVNAVLAGSVEFEEPLYMHSTDNLVTSIGQGSLTIDEVAVYNVSATYEKIGRHFLAGTNYVQARDIASSNGGQSYTFTDFDAEIYSSEMFFDEESWSLGLFDESVSLTENGISNTYDSEEEVYLQGSWLYDYAIDPDEEYIVGSKVEWISSGTVIMEYSMDGGATWTVIENGGESVGLANLQDGVSITYRVSLGSDNERATIDSLIITMYSSRNLYGTDEVNPAIPALSEQETSDAPVSLQEISSGIQTDSEEVNLNVTLQTGNYLVFVAAASQDFLPEISVTSNDFDWLEIGGAETEKTSSSVFLATVYEDTEEEIQITAKDYDESRTPASTLWSIQRVDNYGDIFETNSIVGVGSSAVSFLGEARDPNARAFSMMVYESANTATSTTDIKIALTDSYEEVGLIVVGDDSEFMTALQADWGESVDYSALAFAIMPRTNFVAPTDSPMIISDDSRATTSFSNNAGLNLSEGIKVIGEDTASIELYVRPESGSFDLISTSDASVSVAELGEISTSGVLDVFVNGVSADNISIKDWSHLVATFNESWSGTIYVGSGENGGNPMQGNIGYLAMYEQTLSQEQAKSLFDSATGSPGVKIAEDSFGTFRDSEFNETGTGFRAYTYDWSSTPS
jgi:hypothetical protein